MISRRVARIASRIQFLVTSVLQGVIDRVPLPVQEGSPAPDDLSIKELYGLLARADEKVYLPRFQQVIREDAPPFDPLFRG